MTKATVVAGVLVTTVVLVALAFVFRSRVGERPVEGTTAAAPAVVRSPATVADQGFLYGRVTDADGVTYEGRLRWGGDQEAFWNDYFNGTKEENRWAAHAPSAQRHSGQRGIEIFGIRFGGGPDELRREFMTRFGDIARIAAHVGTVEVTLKSRTQFVLDRFAAGDIDDGVRVWDRRRGVVNLDARQIRTIEFLATASLASVPERLHGTVHTRQGDFTGYIQWDRQDFVGGDTLNGRHTDGSERSLRYDTIRSIARRSRDSALVTLRDGREVVLSGTRDVGRGNRGIFVDDVRFGRVQMSWDVFERVDFSPNDSGPGYGEFPPGRPLSVTVTTGDGRRLSGRLVYDFDESETTELLDTAREGIDYAIPFALIASIVPRGRGEGDAGGRAVVIMRDGRELQFERSRDLDERNAGVLVFVEGRENPEYLSWSDVESIAFAGDP